jgi:hypothetical protein
MRHVYILVIGIFCIFLSHAAESSGTSPKDRLRAALRIVPPTVSSKLSGASSGDSLNSLLSPKPFAPENVLNGLDAAIQRFKGEVAIYKDPLIAVKRKEFLDLERWKIERDLEAVKKRYTKGKLCDFLLFEYSGNQLLRPRDNSSKFLSTHEIYETYVRQLSRQYGLAVEWPRAILNIHKIACLVKKEPKLFSPEEKAKWAQVLDIFISDQARKNYEHFLMQCSIDQIKFDEQQYSKACELAEQFKRVAGEFDSLNVMG